MQGSGSIQKKGKIYYAVIAIGGKRKWIKGGNTKKDAQKVLTENLNAIEEGTFQNIKKVTFREFSKIWINTHVNAHIKETARDEYQYVVDRLVKHFEDVQLQAITGAHVQGFINKRMEEVQASTTRNNTIILKEIFKHACAWGYIKRNPASNIDNPKVTKKKIVILNIADVNKVIDKIHPHYRVAVLTAVLTGLRANELWGLTWEDVDFNEGVLHVRHSLWRGRLLEPKTDNSIRKVDISATLLLELKKWKLQCPLNEMNLVFPTLWGNPVNHNNFILLYYKKALEAAEVNYVKWHGLRHTNASIRIHSEQNSKYLSEQLGHASIKTTYDLYGHVFNDAKSRKEQVDKLEGGFFGR